MESIIKVKISLSSGDIVGIMQGDCIVEYAYPTIKWSKDYDVPEYFNLHISDSKSSLLRFDKKLKELQNTDVILIPVKDKWECKKYVIDIIKNTSCNISIDWILSHLDEMSEDPDITLAAALYMPDYLYCKDISLYEQRLIRI